jgi:hypothetical protein
MSKILEVANLEIGIKESPPDSNSVKYNDWIYNKHVEGSAYPWCGAFVSWCFFMAGFPITRAGLKRGFVGCQYAVTNVKKWGRIVTVPKAEDIVFFDWNGDGHFDHTGIFVKDLGKGLFETIEGNTAFGNDSNGGQVMRRADRRYKNAIFVRPFATNSTNI